MQKAHLRDLKKSVLQETAEVQAEIWQYKQLDNLNNNSVCLLCVSSDFFPRLLICWFAAGGEYWGLS